MGLQLGRGGCPAEWHEGTTAAAGPSRPAARRHAATRAACGRLAATGWRQQLFARAICSSNHCLQLAAGAEPRRPARPVLWPLPIAAATCCSRPHRCLHLGLASPLQSLVGSDNFTHILRVLNTNVDGKQKIMYALTAIKGLGRRFSNICCKKAEVDLNKR